MAIGISPMTSAEPHALQSADRGAEVRSSSLLVGLRQFAERCTQGLTWQRVGVVIAFSALYGGLLSINRQTGGAPQSVATYLAGLSAALALFFPVFVVVTVASNFAPERIAPRAIVLALAVAFAIALGYWVMDSTQAMAGGRSQKLSHTTSRLSLVVFAWLGLAIYLFQERGQAAMEALRDETEHQLNLGRQMSEAQLQVLQSQIEPHFLFNSLAHVRRLYHTDPGAGRSMLRHLSSYLSVTHTAMRESGIPLRQDLELAIAYLNIQQIRMGPRLTFEIDVPPELGAAQVPPMTITTLVENSIKHGLASLPDGGKVRICARVDGDVLRVDVSDTGQGFQASLGAGVGLANIRARLAILYSGAAQLSLAQNVPRGVTATIIMPTLVVDAG
jgi:sensor histidine kinase YesM